jgi:hypothetical protein
MQKPGKIQHLESQVLEHDLINCPDIKKIILFKKNCSQNLIYDCVKNMKDMKFKSFRSAFVSVYIVHMADIKQSCT